MVLPSGADLAGSVITDCRIGRYYFMRPSKPGGLKEDNFIKTLDLAEEKYGFKIKRVP